MKRFLPLAACLAATVGLAAPAAAQDMVQVAGKAAKVVLENERVRVIEITVPPGGSTGMHSHAGDQLVVFLSGATGMQQMADGTQKAMNRKPGEVAWNTPVTHDTKNTGQQPVRTLVIELKGPPLEAAP
jgi:quercetin dioxygenase-like cupin family protein